MRSALILILATAGLSSAEPPAAVAKKDQECIQGVWKVILVEHEGKRMTEEQVKMTVAFTPTMFLSVNQSQDGPGIGSFALNPTQSPKAMDMKTLSGRDKTANGLCAYELEGDTLRICIPSPGKDRPKEISAKPDDGQLVITLKRIKE